MSMLKLVKSLESGSSLQFEGESWSVIKSRCSKDYKLWEISRGKGTGSMVIEVSPYMGPDYHIHGSKVRVCMYRNYELQDYINEARKDLSMEPKEFKVGDDVYRCQVVGTNERETQFKLVGNGLRWDGSFNNCSRFFVNLEVILEK